MRRAQEMWLALYLTPLATVAAISGHAPAGGCMLAMACDARVMVDGKYMIGVNEVQLLLWAAAVVVGPLLLLIADGIYAHLTGGVRSDRSDLALPASRGLRRHTQSRRDAAAGLAALAERRARR